MTTTGPVNLWTSSEHVNDYLERADQISHRTEGEAALLEFIVPSSRRILDLGTGDGRLLALVRQRHPDTDAVAVDFSPAMLAAVRKRFCAQRGGNPPYQAIVGMTNSAPSLTPDGQREVTVFVLV